uniref:V-type proton ATPase subunit G n=1 Tax=Spongospora subterranea TaxID=70186 RepID=A0A0H5R6X9_9EUKA|eukprot:CRZ09507.1 hypothetical protein [Spongospora subterranea]
MASGNEGIQQLLTAEAEATAIVEEARAYRKKKLKSAEQGAQSEIAAFRAQAQAKFEQETSFDIGSIKSYQNDLESETKAALETMTAAYQKNCSKIVDLLVHHVTTVKMDVPDNLAQCIKATMPIDAGQ